MSSAGEGVAKGVGHEFVQHQRERCRHGGGERDGIDVAIDAHTVIGHAGFEFRHEFADEFGQFEMAAVLARAEQAMGNGKRSDALGHALQGFAGLPPTVRRAFSRSSEEMT